MNQSSQQPSLAELIVDAQRRHQPLQHLNPEQVPVDAAAAYALQQDILRLREAKTGGWKIGSKSHTGPIQGSPLPVDCLYSVGSELERGAYFPPGLELEIAFRFNRSFSPRTEAYSDEEVRLGIGSMAATIEVVSSRFAAFPKVEPLAQLADLLNHGALIVGEFIDYRDDFEFLTPSLSFTYAGQDIVPGNAANPAGDPRRLLAWLVNHYTQQDKTLPADTVITTGSYTGMHVAQGTGLVSGEIKGLPAVSLSFV